MEYKSFSQQIPELVGQRITHTFPDYGTGQISNACLDETDDDISIEIDFDNGREANRFILIKCLNKGLLSMDNSDYDIHRLQRIIQNQKGLIKQAMREESKRRKEEATRIMEEQKRREKAAREEAERRKKETEAQQEAERKRQEEEWLEAFHREIEENWRNKKRKRAEWLAAAQLENEQQLEEKKRIYDYLINEREVKFLVHFTPDSNLKSILAHGIMTRFDLLAEEIQADTPDWERLDARTDYSSFSISFPNYRIFYSKRMNTPYTYVILIIDPQIILDLPLAAISYLPDNAASGTIRNVEEYTGLEAAKALFYEKVQVGETILTREQLTIPDWFTTNPQAEVFIRTTVPPKYIRSIITVDSDQANQIRTSLQSQKTHIPKVIYNKSFFRARDDYRFWTAQTNSAEE